MSVSKENFATKYISFEWVIKSRQLISIVVVLACVALLLTTPPSWEEESIIGLIISILGFVLIVIAAFGRIWSSLYISGYKEDRIVSEGPYAIVRNPLYVSSFIGALGMGLETKNLLVLAIFACAFLFYYPLVVIAEENNLKLKFGQIYNEYAQKVPRFLPRRFHLVEPDIYPVRPRHVRRSLQEIICFFWFYLLLQLVTGIQHNSLLSSLGFL